jgi:NitT/TauT family transport system permease protein
MTSLPAEIASDIPSHRALPGPTRRFWSGGRDIARQVSVVAVGMVMLAIWQWAPPAFGVPRFIIPTLSDTWSEGLKMIGRDQLGSHFISTLWTALAGFTLGSIFGATAGYLLGLSRFWESVLSPYILALQIAPKVAFAPLFIMWFGYTAWPKLLVTVLVVFFPVLINVMGAVRTADRDLVNLARAYSMTGFQTFRKVLFPLSIPALMAGLKISATLAVIGVTVGELVGGNTGLGFLITYGEGQSNTAMVFVSIILLTAIGIALYAVIGAVEKRLLRYM